MEDRASEVVLGRRESQSNVQAAADVNDDDALNTIIEGSDIPTQVNLTTDMSEERKTENSLEGTTISATPSEKTN